MPQTPRPPEQKVKTYVSSILNPAERKFANDSQKMSRQGWRIQSQSATTFLGQMRIVVVYVR